jgi:SAM-dependent methyltransferase
VKRLSSTELEALTRTTLSHYEGDAANFCENTRDHDVSQNLDALLASIEVPPPYTILDLGCGPGRDLLRLTALGHEAIGLDGCRAFVKMAQAQAGCEALQQDFLALDLPLRRFDGIFANASLFHVPRQELPRVLRELWQTLKPRGVLFCSNPHGSNREGWVGGRYGSYLDLETWRRYATDAGFEEIRHFYRPAGKPRNQQPWLATVWRKS